MHQSYLTFSSDTELKDGSLQDARNLLSLALSGLAEAADGHVHEAAGPLGVVREQLGHEVGLQRGGAVRDEADHDGGRERVAANQQRAALGS